MMNFYILKLILGIIGCLISMSCFVVVGIVAWKTHHIIKDIGKL